MGLFCCRIKRNMLELRQIHKDYFVDRSPVTAIKSLSLSFPKKGFVAILGPSGCGKTTLLNIIGGLDRYTSGNLLIDGKSTKGFKDKDWDAYRNRRIGFVFQTYNLIAHETILQNVETGLMLSGVKRKERKERAQEILAKMGLGDVVDKKPNQLSGGQMQRVAIARALANNPDIVLADEPTGALDSKTSVVVLDILKEVSKEKLVIMVTHNEELAKQYSDRIIRMVDGEVVDDSAPYEEPKNEKEGTLYEKKTSMSFLTSLRSSAQNVWTKKGRTLLTAAACSIGIIGVALVLATRNGFSSYVKNVEKSMASFVPLSAGPIQYNYISAISTDKEKYPSEHVVYVKDDSSISYVSHRNRFSKEYIDYLDKLETDPNLKGLARSVMYNHKNLDFHFMTHDGYDADGNESTAVRSINQYSSAGGISSSISSLTGLPATCVHELYGNQEQLSDLYDVVYGHFPKESSDPYETEMVLIVDQYNEIPKSTLEKLGLLSSESKTTKINFADIVYNGEGDSKYKEYKCYRPSDFYQVGTATPLSYNDGETPAWKITGYDTATGKITGEEIKTDMKYYPVENLASLYNKDSTYHPISAKIVGVLRPSRNSYISLMPTSIGYLPSLKETMIEDVETGPGKALADMQRDNWCLFRTDDEASDGLAMLNKAILKMQADVADEKLDAVSQTETILSDIDSVYAGFSVAGDHAGGWYGITNFFENLCRRVGASFEEPTYKDLQEFENMSNAEFVTKIPTLLRELNEGIMNYFAYMSAYNTISSVLVFPDSLTQKEALKNYLDAYNHIDYDLNKPLRAIDDRIAYSDVTETLSESIATMINVVSVVLVVFAAISLVVSSVMTAIITYVSVMERTKEIGILRACGARKRDIGRLFEAECTITGTIAGVIGVTISYLSCIPINRILDSLYPGNNLDTIANLSPLAAILLFALSVALAFISGFIPSRIAARKDPVICLRAE